MIVTRAMVGLQLFLMCGGWLFRATFYWRIPVVPGDPYGLGDILELLIYFALLGSSAVALGLAAIFIVVRSLRQWRSIAILACVGLLAIPLFLVVHSHLPQLMSE